MAAVAKKRRVVVETQQLRLQPDTGQVDTASTPSTAPAVMAVALPSTPDKYPTGNDIDNTIRIRVDKEDDVTTFDIHKGILRFYSKYFQVAITNIEQGRFAESADSIITLDEEKYRLFKAFQTWLYTRRLPTPGMFEPLENYCIRIGKLWCFGDRRQIPLLQNQCVNTLISSMHAQQHVAVGFVPFAYAKTMPNSPLRHLIIELTVRLSTTTQKLVDDCGEHWCEESLRDLAKALIVRPKLETWTELTIRRCDWHVHEEGVKCVNKK